MTDHLEVYLNFMHGQWKPGTTGQWDEKRGPAKPADRIGKSTRSSVTDAERAIESAHSTQREWRQLAPLARAAFVQKTANLLKAKVDLNAKNLQREQGCPLAAAKQQILAAAAALEDLVAHARLERPSSPTVLPTRGTLGVITLISSISDPLVTPAREIASALLEGNTVVWKPSSLAPVSAHLLTRLFEETGLPGGALNLVFGPGATLAGSLLSDLRIAGVSFYGTTENATRVSTTCAARPRLRLRVNTPPRRMAWIHADADLKNAAEYCAREMLGSLKMAWVDANVLGEFRNLLLDQVRSYKTGEGSHPELPPMPSDRSVQRTQELLQLLLTPPSTQLLCGGERIGVSGETGSFFAPTLLETQTLEAAAVLLESSGPLFGIRSSSAPEAALAEVSRLGRLDEVVHFSSHPEALRPLWAGLTTERLSFNPGLESTREVTINAWR